MLSEREKMVAERYSTGQTYKQIAAGLNIAPATVRNHLAAIYRKLGVGNKAELINLVWGVTGEGITSTLFNPDTPTAVVL